MIGIIDYGAGNIGSVVNALARVGEDAESFSDPHIINKFSHIILPGVGSFKMAMDRLNRANWPKFINTYVDSGKPLLGICLGMQLLFDQGDENGPSAGLGLIPGKVKLMDPKSPNKVPHVGWNRLYPKQEHPIMDGIKEVIDFYFVHSYACIPDEEKYILSTCDYGGEFVASVFKNNIVGTQFHPEKSQPCGLTILQNFSDWDGKC